jgi:hypothetical protein
MRKCPFWLSLLLAVAVVEGTAGPVLRSETQKNATRPLRLLQAWRLTPPTPERFDASALLRLPDGTLLTVNDKKAGLYRINLPAQGDSAALVAMPDLFNAPALDLASGQPARSYDLEGLARDPQGRLYVCAEGSRRVFRHDPTRGTTELLPLDWGPVRRWFSRDGNASWEGIAAGGGKLYLANERSVGRIVVIDLESLRVTGSFSVSPPETPARDTHYSDLCWADDRLWVLCRESHCVLKVDPVRERVEASFSYASIEKDPKYGYLNPLPYGFVEGLSVHDGEVWLVVDNNGIGRMADPKDVRPSLWRCEIPD